jgi:uncharacterized repeat protein (TIGR01451 family)
MILVGLQAARAQCDDITLTFAATHVTCNGAANGAINLTVTGGVEPYNYQWSQNGTALSPGIGQDLSGIAAGVYVVTVTDAEDCVQTITVLISQPTALAVTAILQTIPAPVILAEVSGGVAPYTYVWSPVLVTSQVLIIPQPGVYMVTVTDANGCSAVSAPVIVADTPVLTASITNLSDDCEGPILQGNSSGGTPPFTYAWTGPNGFAIANTQNVIAPISGWYTLVVTDATGTTATAQEMVSIFTNSACGRLHGRVVQDVQPADCQAGAAEPPLGGWLVRAVSAVDTFYGVTRTDGHFYLAAALGEYTVDVIAPNTLWQVCQTALPALLIAVGDTVEVGDFAVKKEFSCPAMNVSIGVSQLRRCFSNNYYYVIYCNEGTELAEDAFVVVTLDPFLTFLNSAQPHTNLGGGQIRFDLGDVAVGGCGGFNFQVYVSCDAVLGQAHCTEAHIYPDSTCVPTSPEWSGASLQLTSECTGDSVRFMIRNVGVGAMLEAVEYIVVEDGVMLMQAPVQLGVGESQTASFPANGSTWRMEMEQVAGHPGLSQPSLSVEGCSTTPSFSTGFVTQFPNDDADPWLDIDCTTNIGSFDPNDKQGFPIGYGPTHYIRPGTDLEYLIRFQNTGTDTAFTVRVVDTLSQWLDHTSIRPGASSHAYTFDLSGTGIATFLFENILLPDSNVNQVASNGFVKFSIRQRADVPLETDIFNSAAIYFDFNEPVITNQVAHRIGENFISVGLWQPVQPSYAVNVSPNPFGEATFLTVQGLANPEGLLLQVFDFQGKKVREMESEGKVFKLKRGDWPSGVYFFSVRQKGEIVGNGKLVVQE